jgi:MFS family permease
MSRFTGNHSVAVLCVAQFVVVLDATIVATALPAIGDDLGFRPAELSWVITAYTIVLAGLLILGGRTADLFGPRRMFGAGLAVFTIASAACAVAWRPEALIAARVAQGCGAALLSPAALALLNGLTRTPGSGGRAIGWWTAAGAGGGASGWVLGGLITELAGWRWIFAVNVPIGVVALVLTGLLLPAGRSGPARRTADLPGALLVTAGIGLGVVGLFRISEDAAGPAGWLAIAPAIAVLLWFARHERRTADPLIPGALVRRPGVLGGNLAAAALTGSTTPAMLTAVLYVQNTIKLSPAHGALLFPAFNLAVIAGSLAGPRTLGRLGSRRALIAGFAGVVAGALLMIALPPQGLPVVTLAAAFGVMGLGLGAASVASTASGTSDVPEADRGVAAGLLNSSAQLGTALGLAVTGPLVASAAPMLGYRLGFAAAAAIGVAGILSACIVSAGSGKAGSASAGPAPARRLPNAFRQAQQVVLEATAAVRR